MPRYVGGKDALHRDAVRDWLQIPHLPSPAPPFPGMVGYPEALTDPSYAGQILVLTYPLIGASI